MSKTKKLLSVFLSVLMVLSSVSVGFTAFAADSGKIKAYDGLDENYQALAAALQSSYVYEKIKDENKSDITHYVKAATRNIVGYDNGTGDIAAASEAFYNIIDAAEKERRYSDILKEIDAALSNKETGMGTDYKADMKNVAIGNICGNGSFTTITSNYTYKFTVNPDINALLKDYTNLADVPAKVADKATVYSYTQANNVLSEIKKETGDATLAPFKDFAAIQ